MSAQAECSTCGMGRTGAVRGVLRGQPDARRWRTIGAASHESGRARTQWRFAVVLAYVGVLEAEELCLRYVEVLGKRRINSRCGGVSGVFPSFFSLRQDVHRRRRASEDCSGQ